MPYALPTFNLACNLWHVPHPVTNPPDVISPCNLTPGQRIADQNASVTQPCMYLLLPKLTDIRCQYEGVGGGDDLCEVPAGSGRYYTVIYVDDIGKGFANEHRFALIAMYKAPAPLP